MDSTKPAGENAVDSNSKVAPGLSVKTPELSHRLQNRRTTFYDVAALSIEGVSKAAIARVLQIAWNIVDRWLKKTAASFRRFNYEKITKIRIRELQADEICTMVGGKVQTPV